MKIFRILQAWISDVFGGTAMSKDNPNDQILDAKRMGHVNQRSTFQYLDGIETACARRKPTLH
ncbi:hypothetical protein D3C81_2090810 [compost metagenome]